MTVTYEKTPNPHSLKFQTDVALCEGQFEFNEASETFTSPLAAKIFNFPWVDRIFIQSQSITVTKQDWVSWDLIAKPLSELIKYHIENKEAVISEKAPTTENDINENDSKEVKLIKKVLNEHIRPAVQTDGGDITFQKYENNIVYVLMRGACQGCPSSEATLKEGVEMSLKQALPEIKEVISSN